MKKCRECQHEVSEQAFACPNCGAPYPAKPKWDGFGFEYKTDTTMFGLPLLHISFKYTANRRPVVAKGVVAIGQFGVGIINISQFGAGVISLGQFSLGLYALAQFGAAWSLIAQFGLYVHRGAGQFVISLAELFNYL